MAPFYLFQGEDRMQSRLGVIMCIIRAQGPGQPEWNGPSQPENCFTVTFMRFFIFFIQRLIAFPISQSFFPLLVETAWESRFESLEGSSTAPGLSGPVPQAGRLVTSRPWHSNSARYLVEK